GRARGDEEEGRSPEAAAAPPLPSRRSDLQTRPWTRKARFWNKQELILINSTVASRPPSILWAPILHRVSRSTQSSRRIYFHVLSSPVAARALFRVLESVSVVTSNATARG